MQVSVETTTGLERKLTIAVPSEELDNKVNEKLQEVAKTANIKGFRKGKVPLKIVARQYGAAAREEVAGDLINNSYMQAIEQENVRPAGYPKIEISTLEAGKDLEYVATIEVYPEVQISDFNDYEVTRYNAELTEEDIDNTIETLREQQASFNEVERSAEDGDQVIIDFVGTKEGEEFQGGTGNDVKLVLGSGTMIPGFEEGIVGLKKGDERVLKLTFPEDYQAEELQGADVEFAVNVKTVEEKSLPEVDEKFMKHYGSESVDQFREEIRKNMQRELNQGLKAKMKAGIMDILLEKHDFSVPQTLIDSEVEVLRNQMMQQFGGLAENNNLDIKSLLPDSMFQEQAEKRVTIGLIINEVVKDKELKADPEKVRSIIEENASGYEKPEEVISYYYQNKDLMNGIESVALEDAVFDMILEQANVTDETISYTEALPKQ